MTRPSRYENTPLEFSSSIATLDMATTTLPHVGNKKRISLDVGLGGGGGTPDEEEEAFDYNASVTTFGSNEVNDGRPHTSKYMNLQFTNSNQEVVVNTVPLIPRPTSSSSSSSAFHQHHPNGNHKHTTTITPTTILEESEGSSSTHTTAITSTTATTTDAIINGMPPSTTGRLARGRSANALKKNRSARTPLGTHFEDKITQQQQQQQQQEEDEEEVEDEESEFSSRQLSRHDQQLKFNSSSSVLEALDLSSSHLGEGGGFDYNASVTTFDNRSSAMHEFINLTFTGSKRAVLQTVPLVSTTTTTTDRMTSSSTQDDDGNEDNNNNNNIKEEEEKEQNLDNIHSPFPHQHSSSFESQPGETPTAIGSRRRRSRVGQLLSGSLHTKKKYIPKKQALPSFDSSTATFDALDLPPSYSSSRPTTTTKSFSTTIPSSSFTTSSSLGGGGGGGGGLSGLLGSSNNNNNNSNTNNTDGGGEAPTTEDVVFDFNESVTTYTGDYHDNRSTTTTTTTGGGACFLNLSFSDLDTTDDKQSQNLLKKIPISAGNARGTKISATEAEAALLHLTTHQEEVEDDVEVEGMEQQQQQQQQDQDDDDDKEEEEQKETSPTRTESSSSSSSSSDNPTAAMNLSFKAELNQVHMQNLPILVKRPSMTPPEHHATECTTSTTTKADASLGRCTPPTSGPMSSTSAVNAEEDLLQFLATTPTHAEHRMTSPPPKQPRSLRKKDSLSSSEHSPFVSPTPKKSRSLRTKDSLSSSEHSPLVSPTAKKPRSLRTKDSLSSSEHSPLSAKGRRNGVSHQNNLPLSPAFRRTTTTTNNNNHNDAAGGGAGRTTPSPTHQETSTKVVVETVDGARETKADTLRCTTPTRNRAASFGNLDDVSAAARTPSRAGTPTRAGKQRAFVNNVAISQSEHRSPQKRSTAHSANASARKRDSLSASEHSPHAVRRSRGVARQKSLPSAKKKDSGGQRGESTSPPLPPQLGRHVSDGGVGSLGKDDGAVINFETPRQTTPTREVDFAVTETKTGNALDSTPITSPPPERRRSINIDDIALLGISGGDTDPNATTTTTTTTAADTTTEAKNGKSSELTATLPPAAPRSRRSGRRSKSSDRVEVKGSGGDAILTNNATTNTDTKAPDTQDGKGSEPTNTLPPAALRPRRSGGRRRSSSTTRSGVLEEGGAFFDAATTAGHKHHHRSTSEEKEPKEERMPLYPPSTKTTKTARRVPHHQPDSDKTKDTIPSGREHRKKSSTAPKRYKSLPTSTAAAATNVDTAPSTTTDGKVGEPMSGTSPLNAPPSPRSALAMYDKDALLAELMRRGGLPPAVALPQAAAFPPAVALPPAAALPPPSPRRSLGNNDRRALFEELGSFDGFVNTCNRAERLALLSAPSSKTLFNPPSSKARKHNESLPAHATAISSSATAHIDTTQATTKNAKERESSILPPATSLSLDDDDDDDYDDDGGFDDICNAVEKKGRRGQKVPLLVSQSRQKRRNRSLPVRATAISSTAPVHMDTAETTTKKEDESESFSNLPPLSTSLSLDDDDDDEDDDDDDFEDPCNVVEKKGRRGQKVPLLVDQKKKRRSLLKRGTHGLGFKMP